MSYADFEGLAQPSNIDWNSSRTSGMVNYGDTRAMFVVFYRHSTEDPIASKAAGRRICKGVDHIKIQPPGERLTVIDRPASEEDKRRWHAQWMAYAQGRDQVPDGTPIDLLFPDYPEIGDTLRGFRVHTIEQCAELSGNAIDAIGMGAQEYTNRAKRYLEQAQKGVGFHEMQSELNKRDQEIRLLKNQIEQLNGQLTSLVSLLQQAQTSPGAQPFVLPPGTVPPPPTAQPTSYLPMPGPQFLNSAMPTVAAPALVPQNFDPQTTMIDALHSTAEPAALGKKRGGWPKGRSRKAAADDPVATNARTPKSAADR